MNHWKEVYLLIIMTITTIKDDLDAHYSASVTEYNNTAIVLDNKTYGIHISKKGEIKTFYQVA